MAVTSTLSSYLIDTRRLLHDANGTYWTDADLTASINAGIRQRDRDSGMNRSVVPYTLTVGQSFYDLHLVDTNAYDFLSIIVQRNTERYLMSKLSYTETTSLAQFTTTFSTDPAVYARIGATGVYIAPIPNRALVTEWDVLRTALPLVQGGDVDPLPYPWTEPVPFAAAFHAKLQLQQLDEARMYQAIYKERLAEILAESQTRLVADPYGGIGRY